MDLNEYEEIEISIDNIQDDDLVYGTDNKWHRIKVLEIQNKDLYKVRTEFGEIICSYDHQWTLFGNNEGIYSVIELFNDIDRFIGSNIGVENGPKLINIEYVGIGDCKCLMVDSDDHQFEVISSTGERIFTHNCQGRVVCGRVDTTASLMALGNTLGTAIDGSIKGRGIVSANGVMSNCQIYFDNPEWIDKWFLDRGLDPLGYPPEGLEEQEILLGDDEEEIIIDSNLMEMDFEGIHKEVNNAKKQEFNNV